MRCVCVLVCTPYAGKVKRWDIVEHEMCVCMLVCTPYAGKVKRWDIVESHPR